MLMNPTVLGVTVALLYLWHGNVHGTMSNHDAHNQALSYCAKSLGVPTCPNLPTFDKVNVTAYGGIWYEIGSSAGFKNLQESGSVCIQAVYGLIKGPSDGQGAEISVRNEDRKVKGSISQLSVAETALASKAICQRARDICSQVALDTSSLALGITQAAAVVPQMQEKYPKQSAALLSATKNINATLRAIVATIDVLSRSISAIQSANADLSQGRGTIDAATNSLAISFQRASLQVNKIDKLVKKIETARLQIVVTAEDTDPAIAEKLIPSSFLIQSGQQQILTYTSQIQLSLIGIKSTAPFFQLDSTPAYYNSSIDGKAVQSATSSGKLVVTFPGFPSGDYWILALDGEASNGYSAALVYGCDNNPNGGVDQILFILSRQRTLDQAKINKFLDVAHSLGFITDCNEKFIYTTQENCE